MFTIFFFLFRLLISCLSEGLKEKDKKLIMNVLSAIGLMKDQAYHLARHIWNDVHDDWPFYTDQERQILKRYDVAIKVKVIFFFFLTLKLCTPYYLLRGVTRKEKEKKTSFRGCYSDLADCCDLGQFGTSCLCVHCYAMLCTWGIVAYVSFFFF